MKKFLILNLLLISSFSFSQTLLETITLPNNNFYNYGYGLVYENGKYWISSYSSDYPGIIRAVDSTGVEVDQVTINYPTIKPSQGLTYDGTNFWFIERYGGGDFFKVAPDGTVLDSIINLQLFGGSWYIGGAGWDGTHLWVSVYYPDNDAALYRIDVSSKTIVDTISVFGLQPTGITVKGDTLFYVNDGFNSNGSQGYDRVYAVSLSTEDTLFSFGLPHPSNLQNSPRGLAWDGTYFWLMAEPVTGGNFRNLFKYDLAGSGEPGISVPITNVYFPNTTVGTSANYNLTIYSIGNTTLSVDSIKISGNGFSFDPISFPLQIPTGNSSDVTLNFTPTNYAFYTGTVYIYSNDPVYPVVQVSLKGQGVLSGARIGLSATSHNFGNVWVGEEGITLWDFKIFNMGDQTLQISDLQFNLPEFTYNSPTIPFQIFSTDTLQITSFFYPTQAGTYLDTLKITSNDVFNPVVKISVQGTGFFNPYNYGYMFWEYQVPDNPNTSSDEFRVEGLKPINDITGDGINEVIICTDNYWTICLDGAASGTSFPLWSFNTYFNSSNAGSIGQSWDYGVQDALQIANDLNGDGKNDVVIGTGGGNEHVYAIDGTNGEIIWQFGDDFNPYLGDFEAVDVWRDFTGDGIPDVLAIADGDDEAPCYHSAYLFNGVNGNIIWQYYYPGPLLAFGKSVLSIDDITGDDIPDAVISYGNNGTLDKSVQALNGTNGNVIWTTEMNENKAKELLLLPLPGDSSDVIAGESFGKIHRLNGRTGEQIWSYSLGSLASVIQMALIQDLTGDQIPEVLIASFAGNGLNCLSGSNGSQIWSYPMNFQYGVAAVPDIDGDGVQDVITGDQTGTFYCISGKVDTVIISHNYPGDRINSVNVIPSIDGNLSYELLAGTLEGIVACFSGGTDFVTNTEINEVIPTDYSLSQNYPNPFNPSTKIEFKIPESGLVNLKIYDLLGREVKTLVNEEMQTGIYKIDFDASGLASGIYFYTLNAGGFNSTKKMVLLK
jgi:outer membrane protein assembly factor BamB